jgi:hypothetical protein
VTCAYADTYMEPDDLCFAWDERVVVARKPHVCGECGAAITPRERYGRASGVTDTGPHTWKRCMACVVEADRLQTEFKLCIPWGILLQAKADLEGEGGKF